MTSQVCLQGPDIRFRLLEGKRCVSLTNPGQGVVLPVSLSLSSLSSQMEWRVAIIRYVLSGDNLSWPALDVSSSFFQLLGEFQFPGDSCFNSLIGKGRSKTFFFF